MSFYKPTQAELMQEAQDLLDKRIAEIEPHNKQTSFDNDTRDIYKPVDNVKAKCSLQTCHRYSLYERPRQDPPKDTGAYVPELSARLDNDRNLTDGARRCARKIAELTYRRNRAERSLEVTVTYLMEALGKCRRTIQRYLGNLEREGYIHTQVVYGQRTRMCIGLVIQLQKLIFARHHAKSWPQTLKKRGATNKSYKYRFNNNNEDNLRIISRNEWALKCMDGVFRSLMKTLPLFELDLPATE